MKLEEIKKIDNEYYMNTFGPRTNVAFEHGEGVFLFDSCGRRYMDLLGGIAVNVLGHGHPSLTETICSQAKKVIHTSSLYYIEPQARLAKMLCELSCANRVFFANSGAEANEGAIKLARAYWKKKGNPGKYEIITLKDSFHGRTMATLSATGQEKYQKKFHPINKGFKYAKRGDIDNLKESISEQTCAVMLELIQGESGVYPLEKSYLSQVKKLCEENELLMIFDEIQTGIGRTGTMFGYEQYGIEPDIFTLAKGLGGGVPIGALLARGDAAEVFEPGDHGSTFGGNYLATAAALCVLETITSEGLLKNCRLSGAFALSELASITNGIKEVRGMGLMIGIEFTDDIAVHVREKLFMDGYIVGSVGSRIIRILPPLIITKEHISGFIASLKKILGDRYGKSSPGS
jgi:acetylornithine/N-succinyldiaminopimelate aminotransferase